MNKPTLTTTLATATAAYVATKAETETVRPIVIALKSEIINTFDFQYAPEWADIKTGKITNPSDIDMMSDDDFVIYSDLIHSAYLTAGFDVKPDYCPLLIAGNNERLAARKMVEAAHYITNTPYEALFHRVDLMPRFFDTLVNLVNSI